MYSIEIRKLTLQLYSYFKSLRKTSKVLNISISSISRWIYNLYPKKRMFNSFKQVDLLIDYIKYNLSINPMTSCREFIVKIKNDLNISISRQLVNLIIKKRLNYTYKKIKNKCFSKNKEVKIKEFVETFKNINKDNLIVSIDESGFDKRPKQIYGYGLKGKRIFIEYKNQSVDKYNLLLEVCNNGHKKFIISKDYINNHIFGNFIDSLDYPKNTYFLLDNASIHKTKYVMNIFKRKEYIPLFIPPYSPEYNPIELIFGIIKSMFYKQRFYYNNMYDLIIENIKKIDKEIIIKSFNHVIKNFILTS